MTPAKNIIRLSDAIGKIQNADLLLFRRHGLIAIAGRSIYSHAGMVVLLDDEVFLAEMVVSGGRLVTLKSQIRQYPGRYDLFRLNDDYWTDFNRKGAAHYMSRLATGKYGWWSLAKAALLHLPIVRCFVSPDFGDKTITRYPPFCSQAISRACVHGGGIDPVRMLSNRLTEPADLARSMLWSYRGTFA